MRRRPASILLLLLVGVACGWRGFAQQAGSGGNLSDDERKRQFLKAREEMRTVPATPSPNATPPPKPKPKTRPIEATPRPTPVPTPTPKPATPRPTPTPTPRPRKTEPPPRPPEPTPMPKPRVTPAPVTPTPRVSVTPAPAPVIVEKSGREEEHGLEPAETGGGGFFSRWKYLSKSVQAEINRAPVPRRRWRYIVVHNSGTRQGNAKAFEHYHRRVRKMQNGLAYHFVIGNGTSSGAGQVEVGNRWRRQIQGGHVHSDYLNNIALGICLVGDFNRERPGPKQMAALDELIRFLRQRVGKIDRQQAIVKAHREINPPRWPTDCPGDRFPYSSLRKYD